MKTFKKEGLCVTTEGYYYSKWNTEQEKYIGQKLSLKDIETHLFTNTFFEENVRLKHLLTPLMESNVFSTIFKRVRWDQFIEEINTLEWKEWIGDDVSKSPTNSDIEYLELYEYLEIDGEDNTIDNLFGMVSFHGIGYQSTEESISYSLSATPITDYMNTPIKLGKITAIMGTEKLFKDLSMNVTLGTIIFSILFDMSFFGLGEKRDNFLKGKQYST